MHNAFFLVSNDTPPSPSRRNSIFFDKTLLIMGPDAFETAENIFNDLDPNNPVEKSDNLSRHDRLRQAFIWAGILETASFDFSDPERPTTSYFHGPATNSKSLGLRSKFLKEQREYVSDLFLALDNLMPDYDE